MNGSAATAPVSRRRRRGYDPSSSRDVSPTPFLLMGLTFQTAAPCSDVNTSRARRRSHRTSGAGIAACLAALTLLLLSARPVSAHDLIQEQVVQVTMRVDAGALAVHLQFPVSVLADSTLPRTADGALDTSNIAEPLRIVAADAMRNLDVLQDGRALQQTAFSAHLSPDNTTVEADATFTTRADAGFSARLGTFTGSPQAPVRTHVDFTRQDGRHFDISVMGPAARVDFDPAAGAVAVRFAREMLQRLVTPGLHFLMLVCLLAPLRRDGTAPRLIGLVLATQAIGLLTAATLRVSPSLSSPALLIAASAVVVAALQVIVNVRPWLVAAVALLFGLCVGFGTSRPLIDGLQFAGAHAGVAIAAAAATTLLAQAWAAGALWAARSWLEGRNLPEPAFSIFIAVVAGHSALHQVVASASELAGRGTFASTHATTVVSLLWLLATLGVAAVSAARPGRPGTGPQRVARQSLS